MGFEFMSFQHTRGETTCLSAPSDTPKDAKLAFENISGIVVTRASALAVVSVRALRT